MDVGSEFSHFIDTAKITATPQSVLVTAQKEACQSLALRFDLAAVEALSAALLVRRGVAGSIHVSGQLTAAVKQFCALTGEPFAVTVAEPIDELFLADGGQLEDEFDIDLAAEVEGSAEYVDGGRIDLGELAAQILGVSLDPYARAPGAISQTDSVDTAPAEKPKTASPFADLADRLKNSR